MASKPYINMNIVFLTQNMEDYISGGRMYSWHIAHCLAYAGHKVDIITDAKPVFDREYVNFPGRQNVVIHKENSFGIKDRSILDIVKVCDLIVAAPVTSIDYGVILGEMFRKKVIAFIFEPVNAIMDAVEGGIPIRFTAGSNIYNDLTKQVRKVSMIVCNCDFMKERTKEWLPDFSGKIETLYNGFNTPIADTIKIKSREERKNIVYCSRTERYKGYEDIAQIFTRIKQKVKIDFITGFRDKNDPIQVKFFNFCKEQGIDITIYDKITEKEKFEIISRAKALFFPSRFEGFGLPPAEALYLKTPVICYELPVLREIYGNCLHYAPFEDVDSMYNLIQKLLDNEDDLYRDLDAAQLYVGDFASLDNFSSRLNILIGGGSLPSRKTIQTQIIPQKEVKQEKKDICVVCQGKQNQQFDVCLSEQTFKSYNKIDEKVNFAKIKEDVVILCDSRIMLSKNALKEVMLQMNSGADCVVGNYRIGDEKVYLPEIAWELLVTYPTLICGFVAIKKEKLPFDILNGRFWEFDYIARFLENGYKIAKSQRIMFSIDRPIYENSNGIVLQEKVALCGLFAKKGYHDIKPISDIKNRIVEDRSYEIPKHLIVIPTKIGVKFPELLDSLMNVPNRDIVVCHHVPDGKYDSKIVNMCLEREIPVIKSQGNFNYSKVNNDAVRKYYDGHELIYLLNDDVVLHKDCLKSMSLTFKYRWEKVGVVGAKLLYPIQNSVNAGTNFPEGDIGSYDGFTTIQHGGVQLVKDRRCTHRLYRMPSNIMSSNIIKECQAVTFAVVAIDGKCYQEIKLDEEFALDYGDIDFCIRASQKGWKIIYDANALAFHCESITRKDEMDYKSKNVFRERYEKLLDRQITYNELHELEKRGF